VNIQTATNSRAPMKDSGIDWLGQIPALWKVRRIKEIGSLIGGAGFPHEFQGFTDLELPFFKVMDLGQVSQSEPLIETSNTIDRLTARTLGASILQAGDIVFAKVGAALLLNRFRRIGRACCIDNNMIALRSNALIDPEFALHALSRIKFADIVNPGAVPSINSKQIGELCVALPPLETQKRIAAFLDEKTAQIDGLIEKKRTLLDRLAEKRQALITQAVTKGLNPAAPMKDSGIDWLGQIPAHWEKGNIRRFATMKTGHTPSRAVSEYWDDCTIPWFTLSDVWQLRDGTRVYIEETAEKISTLGLANSAAELLPSGTVIFSRTASIGFSGIMPCPMATTQDFWNWICGQKLRSEYLLFLFRAMTQKFSEITNGSTHKTIYQPIAAGLEICVPPLAEQDAISTEIQKSMKLIDSCRSKVTVSIDRLTEYRSALITAAVTGQIEGLR